MPLTVLPSAASSLARGEEGRSRLLEVVETFGTRAQGPEPEAPPSEQRHELAGRLHGLLPIGTRILMMPVVHHDDVAVRCALG